MMIVRNNARPNSGTYLAERYYGDVGALRNVARPRRVFQLGHIAAALTPTGWIFIDAGWWVVRDTSGHVSAVSPRDFDRNWEIRVRYAGYAAD